MFEDLFNPQPQMGTFEDSLESLLAGPTNEEKRKKKELEELQKRELERALKLEKASEDAQKRQEEYFNQFKNREDQLRNLPNTQQRLPEVTDQLWKERFGFSPVGKKGVGGFFQKLGAGLLEGASRLNKKYTPIGEEAFKRSSKNYKDEYDKLLGVERLEAQQYRDQGNLQQKNLEALLKGGVDYSKMNVQRDLAELNNKTRNRAIDVQQELGEAAQKTKNYLAYYQAEQMKAKAGDIEAATRLKENDLAVAEALGFDPKDINDSNRAAMFSQFFNNEKLGKIIDTEKKLKDASKKPDKPIIKFIPEAYNDEAGNPQQRYKIFKFDPNGNQIGGSSSTEQPNANPAQKIQGAVRQTPLGREPITPDGKYFPKGTDFAQTIDIVKNTPLGEKKFGSGNNAIKLQNEYNKEKKAWDGLARRNLTVSQIAFNALATGDLEKWKDPKYQNDIADVIRAATGNISGAEIVTKQNDMFNLLEHIKTRFSGRPAYAMIQQIGKQLDSKWDSAETFARKAGSINLLVELAKKEADDPRFAEQLDIAEENLRKDPERSISFGEAYTQEVEEAVKNAKEGKRNAYPTVDGILKRMTQKRVLQQDYEEKRKRLLK